MADKPLALDDVDLLDLCILAYQLHTQTLVFAPDPYIEQLNPDVPGVKYGRRNKHFEKLKTILNDPTITQNDPWVNGLKANWEPKSRLDPILSQFGSLNPFVPGIVHQEPTDPWIRYAAPPKFTDHLAGLWVASYDRDKGLSTRTTKLLDPFQSHPASSGIPKTSKKTDWLYAFEGATGMNKMSVPGLWSLLGIILDRQYDDSNPQNYDVYVAFRGSRSGDSRIREWIWINTMGNPDWASNTVLRDAPVKAISPTKIHNGFALSCESALNNISACLEDIATRRGAPPREFIVTGHSLGGGLAQCFACAADHSETWQLPKRVLWPSVKIVTFGAPAAGPEEFMKCLWSKAMMKCYRFVNDPVPTIARNRSKWNVPGKDLRLGWYPADSSLPMSFQAHSPEHIRPAVKSYIGRSDNDPNPWSEMKLQDLLTKFLSPGGQDGYTNKGLTYVDIMLTYQFRRGLILYILAYPSSSSALQTFCAGIKNWKWSDKVDVDVWSTAGRDLVWQLATEVKSIHNDTELQWMLLGWLALIAAEDGFDWSKNPKLLTKFVRPNS